MSEVSSVSVIAKRETLPSVEVLKADADFLSQSSDNRLRRLMDKPDAEKADWHVRLSAVHLAAGRLAEAAQHGERAIELAVNDNELSDGLRSIISTALHLGDIELARTVVGRLHGVAYGSRAQRPMANFSEAQGFLRLRTGDLVSGSFYESESRYRNALRAWQAMGDADGCMRSYHGLASAMSATGMYAEAVEQLDLALEQCQREHLWRWVPSVLMDRAFALRDPGLHEPARIDFVDAIAWSEALGDVPALVRSLMGYMVLVGYDVTVDDNTRLPEFEAIFERARAFAEQARLYPRWIEIHQRAAELYEKIGMPDKAAESGARWREVAAQEAGSGVQGYFQGQVVERQELEAQRQKRFRVRMQETIESTPDALLVLDPVRSADGRVADLVSEFRNHAADRMFDAGPTSVLSLGQLETFPAFRGLSDAIGTVIETQTPYSDEILVEETEIWLGRRVVLVGDGAAVTFRDTTIEHAAADALRKAAESARQSDHAKSVFLANMSHEVRTPINGVLGLARLLSDSDLRPEQRMYVDGIVSSADILLGVLGDVLDLSKIEAGRVDINPEPTELRALISRVAGLFAGQAKQAGISLTVDIDSAIPPMVLVDATRLRQVLANLIGNAIKFTKRGSVRVHVWPTGGQRTRFEVIDTGPGVPEDRRQIIFDAFRQGGTQASMYGGSGLGLTISRRIVEMMGGAIGLECPEPVGSTFWVEIPLIAVNVPETVRTSKEADLSGLKVLLVEDNPVNTMVATGLLNNAGCIVQSVGDGAEAIDAASAVPFDVILMDIRMPGMDGLEATRQIRRAEISRGRRVPIIAVTASAFTDDRDECFQAGMDDYLGKPFTAEALRAALARWTARAH